MSSQVVILPTPLLRRGEGREKERKERRRKLGGEGGERGEPPNNFFTVTPMVMLISYYCDKLIEYAKKPGN